MLENTDLILLFTALTTIFSLGAFLTEYYYRVHRPRAKDKEQKRGEIYKPLLNNIEKLIEKVRAKEEFRDIFNWRTVEERVSAHLYVKLERVFQEKVDKYNSLLKHNQDFIRFKGYYYLNAHLPELQKEYLSLGVGGLEFDLYEIIVKPILESQKISLRWLEEHKPDLYEHLTKCPKYKRIKDLFSWMNEEIPSVITFRNVEQDLLQSAKELKNELESF